MTPEQICLSIYLLIGLIIVYRLRVEGDRKLLFAKPFAALVIAVSWPAFFVMLIPRAKNFKSRGKTYWERKKSHDKL